MDHSTNFDSFLKQHKDQLISSGVPEIYWPLVSHKIQNQIFDAGEAFQLMQICYDEQRKPYEPAWGLQVITHIKKVDPRHIYLIDHAWTFQIIHAKKYLQQSDSLCSRLCKILGLKIDSSKEALIEDILSNIWRVCQTYSFKNTQNVENSLAVWYVMDEIGSAVTHSDTPNCKIVPFFYVSDQIMYSLLFPIEDINEEQFVFIDFAEGIHGEDERAAALLPLLPKSFQHISIEPEVPSSDYYLSGHITESLPNIGVKFPEKHKYSVFTEYSLVKQYLTCDKFIFVDKENEADILWLTRHFKDFAELRPDIYINQFPFEYVITIKDLLALTCRKSSTTIESSIWHPITYNLQTEVKNFVSYFQHRESRGLDNYWIVKPYNLARSLDIHITNNLSYIMRLPLTGPKIAQKYITNPVLFYRPECEAFVKFDVRYVILLKSVQPLKAYVYNNFFIRFANKQFALKNFHDYEVHFTVMNYDKNITMKHMLCSEFILQWEQQFPSHKWRKTEKYICKMLRSVLECAVKDEPPRGIGHSPQSRAVYAADIMLEWNQDKDIVPKLLEINWTPDCKRACQYYPNFYNDIFSLLFLNKYSDIFTEL